MKTVTQSLTQRLASLQWSELPQEVVHEAKRALINVIGLSIHRAHHPSVKSLLDLTKCTDREHRSVNPPSSKHALASVVGRKEVVPIHLAALINGFTAHFDDFDDTHLPTIVHPSAPVYPAALAVAEWRGASGKELIMSFLLGCELEIRMAEALGDSHFRTGWHVTASTGAFGAAVAAGHLFGFGDVKLAQVLGIAGSLAAGTMSSLGSLAKPLHPGKAAYGGVLASLLVASDFTGPLEIDGRRSFLRIASTTPTPEALSDGLGVTWRFLENTYKPYPCGIVSHAAIDCARHLISDTNVQVKDLGEVDLYVHPDVLRVMGLRDPKSGLEGKFSIYHTIAVALKTGTVRTSDFTDQAIQDPDLHSLRQLINVHSDESLLRHSAVLIAQSLSGQSWTINTSNALGSIARPLSDTDIEEKFLELTTTQVDGISSQPMSVSAARELLNSLWVLEQKESVREVGFALR